MVFSCLAASALAMMAYNALYFTWPGGAFGPLGGFSGGLLGEFPRVLLSFFIMMTPSIVIVGVIGIAIPFKGYVPAGAVVLAKAYLVLVAIMMFMMFMRSMEDEGFGWVGMVSKVHPVPEWVAGMILIGALFGSYKLSSVLMSKSSDVANRGRNMREEKR
jgi:hypothetical protein